MGMRFGNADIEPVVKTAIENRNINAAAESAAKTSVLGGEDSLFVADGFIYEEDKILVVSCGNAGGNILKNILSRDICSDVEYVMTDTDYVALNGKINFICELKGVKQGNLKELKEILNFQPMLFGETTCRGKGAGAHPEVAAAAALESEHKIRKVMEKASLVFIVAGEGGGTGTGSSPVVARMAREAGAIVVAIVTKPFRFENKLVMDRARRGIAELRENVDAILVVDNQKLLSVGEENASLIKKFSIVDYFVGGVLSGFVNVTNDSSIIKLDFNDIKFMFEECKGNMFIGAGEATYTPAKDTKEWDGGVRAMMEAVENAISSPLIDNINLANAKGVISLYQVGEDVSLEAINKAQERINEAIGNEDNVNIIVGADGNEEMNGKIKVFFILAGLNDSVEEEEAKKVTPMPNILSRPVFPGDRGEKISLFDTTNQAMRGEGGRAITEAIVREDGFRKTQVIESVPETVRIATNIMSNSKSHEISDDSPLGIENADSEKRHTPSILGIETTPLFLRTQCQ